MIKFKVVMRTFFIIVVLFIATLSGCKENYTPKPHAYFRINFPQRNYKQYKSDCNFSFEIPVYSSVYPDSSKNAEPCWYNLYFTPFNAKLHLSYKAINETNELLILKEDARELVYKHTVKADEISENFVKTASGYTGILYELEGSTATAVSFYLTDSTSNFIRGSLYFSTRINRDSLDPIIDFLEADIKHLINTLKWSNTNSEKL